MNEANPYKSPLVTESPAEQVLESLSDKKVKRLYTKSLILRRFTFLFIFYSIICLPLSAASSIFESWLFSLIMLLLVAFGGITFIAAHYRPSWGRTFCFTFSALALLLFPVGTMTGIILIVNLLGAERLFGSEKVSHKRVMEENLRRKYRAQLKTKTRPNTI